MKFTALVFRHFAVNFSSKTYLLSSHVCANTMKRHKSPVLPSFESLNVLIGDLEISSLTNIRCCLKLWQWDAVNILFSFPWRRKLVLFVSFSEPSYIPSPSFILLSPSCFTPFHLESLTSSQPKVFHRWRWSRTVVIIGGIYVAENRGEKSLVLAEFTIREAWMNADWHMLESWKMISLMDNRMFGSKLSLL